jgi:RNA polymerase sigma-70 factor (ECF subfamily)
VTLVPLDNEKELLLEVAGGNEVSFRLIFDNYWDQIYSMAYMFTKSPELAEDITQDVFAQIWEKRVMLKQVNRFEAFLYVITRNLIIDRLRKKVPTAEYQGYLEAYFEESAYNPVQQMETKQFKESIHNAISRLPTQQQMAFRLSRFNDLSHEEIAALMGISRQTVKSYIVRAIVTLRKYMLEQQDGLYLVILFILSEKYNAHFTFS